MTPSAIRDLAYFAVAAVRAVAESTPDPGDSWALRNHHSHLAFAALNLVEQVANAIDGLADETDRAAMTERQNDVMLAAIENTREEQP